ncbi:uncharacterized protein LOC118433206 isoform X2 [Folsomia candida]|uniref:uncharacterized protein LOC118433206 isoform X2 n=1 Tax=Folsomia candida TaxID=158441 RepID=UPI001604F988|nr:uncharacterized protein LOC118433206 isoform X2 [Folsomia candida]
MVAAGVDFVGDDYVEYIEPFASAFQACFLNDDWFTCCRVDKRFSLGTYRAWRQGNAGCDVCLECQMFVCGIRVSQNVRRHPVFKRIITIALTNVAWVNDIFGAGKDFSSAGNHPDNEIVFRVVEKEWGTSNGESACRLRLQILLRLDMRPAPQKLDNTCDVPFSKYLRRH